MIAQLCRILSSHKEAVQVHAIVLSYTLCNAYRPRHCMHEATNTNIHSVS